MINDMKYYFQKIEILFRSFGAERGVVDNNSQEQNYSLLENELIFLGKSPRSNFFRGH